MANFIVIMWNWDSVSLPISSQSAKHGYEEIEYYKCLQLFQCGKFVNAGLPYSEVADFFTDVEITEQEYNTLLQDPSTVDDYIKSKGYKESL